MPKSRHEREHEDLLSGILPGEKYDSADFVIPARDHQGHSERGWFQMQPMVDRALDVVLRSKKFPFRTKGDVIRWCVVRGLKVLERLEPEPGFIGKAEIIIEACRVEEYNQTFGTMFEYVQRVVNQSVANKMTGEARRLLATAKAEVMKIPEDEWRNRCLEELKERFGHLMTGEGEAKDGKGKVKLSTEGGEE